MAQICLDLAYSLNWAALSNDGPGETRLWRNIIIQTVICCRFDSSALPQENKEEDEESTGFVLQQKRRQEVAFYCSGIDRETLGGD